MSHLVGWSRKNAGGQDQLDLVTAVLGGEKWSSKLAWQISTV